MSTCIRVCVSHALVALTAIVISVTPVLAQVDRANLSGTVTDPSGSLVPQALVTIASPQTGLSREVRTSGDGVYRFLALPAGSYLVTVTKDGFDTALVEDVRLTVGQNRSVDITMKVGAVTSEVLVTGVSPLLDTRTAEIGSAVTSEQIEGTPLNGRNWASLMSFAPGAINTGEGNQGNIRFFGRARDDNNWTFDGVDATGIKDPRQEASLRLVMSLEGSRSSGSAPRATRQTPARAPAPRSTWCRRAAPTGSEARCSTSSATRRSTPGACSTRCRRSRPSGSISTASRSEDRSSPTRRSSSRHSKVPGGFDVSTVLMARSGRPINVTTERTAPDGSDVNQRPNLVPGVEAVTGDPSRWLNPAAFATPAAGQFGSAPRNGFRGPGAWQLDLSLSKRIRFASSSSLELRADGFNIFNIDQYGNPNRNAAAPLTFGLLTPLNAQPTGTGTARQFQLGVRVSF